MYTAVIFAAMAVAVFGHPHDPDPTPVPTDPNLIAECTFWTQTEKCRYAYMKKYANNYEFAHDTHMRTGMMAEKPEVCDDGDRWDIDCPCDYHDDWDDHCDDIKGTDAELKYCRHSCQECGSDAFLTLKDESKDEELERCCEYSKHYPYKCVKKEKMTTQLYPMLIANADLDCGQPDPQHLCIGFDFRRRAMADPKPKVLTYFVICEQTKAVDSAFSQTDDDKVVCNMNNALLEHKIEDDNHFNAWRRFRFQREAVDGTMCNLERRIIVKFHKGSDHYDIDNFRLYQGHCLDEAGAEIEHGEYAELTIMNNDRPE